ncbi:MAG TPA: penicillin-binding transpeptidase domain-containing protein [Nocardioidaceae bacterium]|nr:penicillin-binding transpeptidase domain-containing protein [Nocardioidaceae bacterium]
MRSARLLAATVVLGMLTACTGTFGEGPEDSAADAARGFLDRWSAGQVARAARATDSPQRAGELLADVDAGLQIRSTTYELTGEATCGEQRCRQPVRLTHTLAGMGEWSYRVTVPVDRPADDRADGFTVAWSPQVVHPRLSADTRLSRERELPPRASILDRDGRPLTRNGEVSRVGVVPRKVQPQTYDRLQQLLDIDPAGLRDSVGAAEPDWFVPVITLRAADYRPVADELLQVPGVAVDSDVWSLPPTSTWGRALLGSVAPATAETLEAAGPLASSADVVGTSGLQLAFQRQLAGRPGGSVLLVDGESGATVDTLHRTRPERGEPLRTTLDRDTQASAEEAVQAARKLTALVAVDSSTGDILASAVGPGIQSYNTAFVGRYPPGSTFKVLATAALLEEQAVQLEEPALCPPTTTVQGKSFKNYDDFEPLPANGTFADAFAASCNTAIVSRADELGDGALHDMAARFGVGVDWDLGVDAFSGSVPTTSSEVDRAAAMIGQGKVLMSPLAMAMVAAAVDSGRPKAPTLLPEGSSASAEPASGASSEPLPDSLARSLRSLMRLVVTQGTASVLDLPGEPVHAKTGTAEFDSDDPSRTHAWMIGFRGDVAFAVLVENGASGSEDAAPVVRTFLEGLPAR